MHTIVRPFTCNCEDSQDVWCTCTGTSPQKPFYFSHGAMKLWATNKNYEMRLHLQLGCRRPMRNVVWVCPRTSRCWHAWRTRRTFLQTLSTLVFPLTQVMPSTCTSGAASAIIMAWASSTPQSTSTSNFFTMVAPAPTARGNRRGKEHILQQPGKTLWEGLGKREHITALRKNTVGGAGEKSTYYSNQEKHCGRGWGNEHTLRQPGKTLWEVSGNQAEPQKYVQKGIYYFHNRE